MSATGMHPEDMVPWIDGWTPIKIAEASNLWHSTMFKLSAHHISANGSLQLWTIGKAFMDVLHSLPSDHARPPDSVCTCTAVAYNCAQPSEGKLLWMSTAGRWPGTSMYRARRLCSSWNSYVATLKVSIWSRFQGFQRLQPRHTSENFEEIPACKRYLALIV